MKLQLTSLILAFVSMMFWQFIALFIPTDNGLILGMTFITWMIFLSVYMANDEIKKGVR